MKYLQKGFTFVELIVVLTIVAILATVWFTVYESYLWSWRDTNRIVQLKDIHGWLTVHATKTKLPFPEDMVTIESSGNIISYQGNISEDIINSIQYNGGWKDTELWIFPTYSLSNNRKDFQLLSFVEDAETLLLQAPTVQANVDYISLFPKVIGSPLGIILNASTQEPLQVMETVTDSNFDIATNTQNLRVYYSDRDFFDTSWWDLYDIIPNKSCKRILWMGKSRWNGEYTILPDGISTQRVYCDMEIDGWGWTLIARSVDGATGWNFGWNYSTWSIADDSQPFSFGSGSRFLWFDNILNAKYLRGKDISSAVVYSVDGDFLVDNYNLQDSNPTDDNYVANINECRAVLNVSESHCGEGYTYRQQYWWKFGLSDSYFFSYRDDVGYWLNIDEWNFRSGDEYNNVPAMIFVK